MFNRVKRALIESYIGAIALGYLLAECVLHLAGTFAEPLTEWASQRRMQYLMPNTVTEKPVFSLAGADAEFVRFLVLLLVWYLLLRWLYLSKKVDLPPAHSEHAEER